MTRQRVHASPHVSPHFLTLLVTQGHAPAPARDPVQRTLNPQARAQLANTHGRSDDTAPRLHDVVADGTGGQLVHRRRMN
jgi:hypothetical protein